ncbi:MULTISPECIES: hypothetical protein [unclassified Devosia]|jgi:hypothetical protein|nr:MULTISPECIES: hypothetical protein [unclassified Devosia]
MTFLEVFAFLILPALVAGMGGVAYWLHGRDADMHEPRPTK